MGRHGRPLQGDIVGRATLYLYEKDYALRASNLAHKLSDAKEKCRAGNQRGLFSERVLGVQTVDWSCLRDPVDSHSYYLHSNFISADLQNIIFNHQQPVARNLNLVKKGAASYYLHTGISDPKDCLPN